MPRAASVFAGLQSGDPRESGGFRLLARLGEGGMGQVFLALSPGGQWAAVKVLRSDFAGDAEFRERFAAEVRAAPKVRGAHLAPLLAADLEGARPWLATTYVAGPSLHELVAAHGPLPAGQVMLLAWGIAHALTDIHAAGIVHRDLKPGNIILDETGPKVIDFGIVKSLTQSVTYRSTSTRIGTPLYMSPEQALGRTVGAPSDVFALGSTLHRLATGREAFAADNEWAVAHRVVADHPDLTGLTPPLRDLIAACLDKDPGRRPTPDLVRTWCETELGDTLGPGAWMTVNGSQAAIRSRTQALRTLAAPTSTTAPDSAAPATPPAGSTSAPGSSLEPVVVTKDREEKKITPHMRWEALKTGLAAGAFTALVGMVMSVVKGWSWFNPGVPILGSLAGIAAYVTILQGFPGPKEPDVVIVDSQGLTIQWRGDCTWSYEWAEISAIKVIGGRQSESDGSPTHDRTGRLLEDGPETELHVRYLAHVLPDDRDGDDVGSGWYRIYGPSRDDPTAVDACRLRDGLARFAGDRYDDPNPPA